MKPCIKRYIVYIAPELQKFNDTNWTNKFFEQFQDNNCFEDFDLPKYPDEFIEQFSTEEGIVDYLKGRPKQSVIRLSTFLSSVWRNNTGLLRKLTSFNNWKDKAVPIEKILVYPAEPSFHDYFEENEYLLCRILEDRRIMDELPYRNYEEGTSVIFKTLLAVQKDQNYRIFDGVHRAVQLALNGDKELLLHYGHR